MGSSLLKAFLEATPEEQAQFRELVSAGTAAAAEGTPKFSKALDKVPEGKIARALALLGKCQGAATPEKYGEAIAAFGSEFPEVLAAAERNSRYRNKDSMHSVGVAIRYLTIRFSELPASPAPAADLEATVKREVAAALASLKKEEPANA